MKNSPLVSVRDLSKIFPIKQTFWGREDLGVSALNGVSVDIERGEILSVVGESGCGKSTLGRCLTRLINPTQGTIAYSGRDITRLSSTEMRPLRKKIQIVFQDPFASLNPRMTVEEIVGEPMDIHRLVSGRHQKREKIIHLLDKCGLRAEALGRFPHEFSGGQRQRIAIARALAVEPEFLVCDEPVSALDVSIQAQIINLLQDLQGEFQLTFLFIAHDLNVVRHISDRVAVMYLGEVVEIGPVERVFQGPGHPYTQSLLSAIPVPDPDVQKKRFILQGQVPSPIHPPSGCRFHTRCPVAQDRCRTQIPESRPWGPVETDGHRVRCHFPGTL